MPRLPSACLLHSHTAAGQLRALGSQPSFRAHLRWAGTNRSGELAWGPRAPAAPVQGSRTPSLHEKRLPAQGKQPEVDMLAQSLHSGPRGSAGGWAHAWQTLVPDPDGARGLFLSQAPSHAGSSHQTQRAGGRSNYCFPRACGPTDDRVHRRTGCHHGLIGRRLSACRGQPGDMAPSPDGAGLPQDSQALPAQPWKLTTCPGSLTLRLVLSLGCRRRIVTVNEPGQNLHQAHLRGCPGSRPWVTSHLVPHFLDQELWSTAWVGMHISQPVKHSPWGSKVSAEGLGAQLQGQGLPERFHRLGPTDSTPPGVSTEPPSWEEHGRGSFATWLESPLRPPPSALLRTLTVRRDSPDSPGPHHGGLLGATSVRAETPALQPRGKRNWAWLWTSRWGLPGGSLGKEPTCHA